MKTLALMLLILSTSPCVTALASSDVKVVDIKISNMNFWIRIDSYEMESARELLIRFKSVNGTSIAKAEEFYTRNPDSIFGWKKSISTSTLSIFLDFADGVIYLKKFNFIHPIPIGYYSNLDYGADGFRKAIGEFTRSQARRFRPFAALPYPIPEKYQATNFVLKPKISKDGNELLIDPSDYSNSVYDDKFITAYAKAIAENTTQRSCISAL